MPFDKIKTDNKNKNPISPIGVGFVKTHIPNIKPEKPNVVRFETVREMGSEETIIACLITIAIKFAGGGFDLWPSDINIFIQLVFALIISEFGLYWFHRACHEIPFLWRFHKIHHNPQRLYWFNATRFHYLDVTLLQVCGIVPLLLFNFC